MSNGQIAMSNKPRRDFSLACYIVRRELRSLRKQVDYSAHSFDKLYILLLSLWTVSQPFQISGGAEGKDDCLPCWRGGHGPCREPCLEFLPLPFLLKGVFLLCPAIIIWLWVVGENSLSVLSCKREGTRTGTASLEQIQACR